MAKHSPKFNLKWYILLPIVVAVTLVIWLMPVTSFGMPEMTVLQQRTMAIFVFAALMWLFEIIPAWATSITTIVFLLFSVSDKGFLVTNRGTCVNFKEILSSFADPIIMLFLGGFILAIAANKVGLDRFLAKSMLGVFGSRPQFVLLGILLVCGTFSMFMSNTATAAMILAFMAPILVGFSNKSKSGAALVLAIPIAANLGGLGTPIGTPPNAIAIGQFASQTGISISFGSWMLHMVPYVLVMLLISWGVLMLLFPMEKGKLEFNIEAPKKLDRNFWIVAIVFFVTILLWITSELTHVDADIVALVPFAVFAITGVFEANDFGKIEWNILWMVAGGFALGYCLSDTGLAHLLVNSIPFASWPALAVIIGIGFTIYLLSTFISNSATASLMMPIAAVLASVMKDGMSVIGNASSMIVYMAICCSLAMTLPISTPPNAIACSTGIVQTRDMVKVGLIIGIAGAVLGFFWLKIFPF